MRTLAVTQNITLDGRIDMLGDWFDDQTEDAAMREANRRQREASDALLVGRDTFEAFAGFWRDYPGDTTGVSAHLDSVRKYVVSSTLTELDWQPTEVISFDDVAALKEQDGADIVCTGSVRLTHGLLLAGLVDEIRLFCYPVVQGRGRTLFPEGYEGRSVRLVESSRTDGGVVLSTYAV